MLDPELHKNWYLNVFKSNYEVPSLSEIYTIPEMTVKKPYVIDKEKKTDSLPKLDKKTTRSMLEKAITIILVETGFEKCQKTAMNVLVDIAEEFLTKICTMFHAFNTSETLPGQVLYHDALEKVLISSGFGGTQGLKDYYKNSVLCKRDKAYKEANELLTSYETLLLEYDLITPISSIPELHFPATGMQQNFVTINELLKPGCKVLLTLDREAQSFMDPNNPRPSTSKQADEVLQNYELEIQL